MRRVNVRNSLKQRLNEMLGTDSGTEGAVPGLTGWSIQAAMLRNLRRVVSGITGDLGRPMTGLWISLGGGTTVTISAGYGFTRNGDVIVVEAPLSYTADASSNDTWHLYLKHSMSVVDESNGGKTTGFIGKTGTEDIVYDDLAAAKGSDAQSVVGSLIQQSTTQSSNPDWVYLGTITTFGGSVTGFTYPDRRGLDVNPEGYYLIPSLMTTGDAFIKGELTVVDFIACNILKSRTGGAIDIQNAVTLQHEFTMLPIKLATLPQPSNVSFAGGGANWSGPAAPTNMTIVNGIVTSAT